MSDVLEELTPAERQWRLLAHGTAGDLLHAARSALRHVEAFTTAAMHASVDNGENVPQPEFELADLTMLERLLGQVDVWVYHLGSDVGDALRRVSDLRALNLASSEPRVVDIDTAKAAFLGALASHADRLGVDGQRQVLDLVEVAMGQVP